MPIAPTFVSTHFETVSAEIRNVYSHLGLRIFERAPASQESSALIDLEEFIAERNPEPSRKPSIIALPENMNHWPAALQLFREGPHWFRSSVKSVMSNPRLYESMPRWISERLLLIGDWAAWTEKTASAAKYQPWRQVALDELPKLGGLSVQSAPGEESTWLSVIVMRSEGLSAKSLAEPLARAGFHLPTCEFLSYTGAEGLKIERSSSAKTIYFEFRSNLERNLLLNFAARHARGDQILLVEDTKTLAELPAPAMMRISPNCQMLFTDGATMIFRGALQAVFGFAPSTWTLQESLLDLAARMDFIHYRVSRLQDGRDEDLFAFRSGVRESLPLIWRGLS